MKETSREVLEGEKGDITVVIRESLTEGSKGYFDKFQIDSRFVLY